MDAMLTSGLWKGHQWATIQFDDDSGKRWMGSWCLPYDGRSWIGGIVQDLRHEGVPEEAVEAAAKLMREFEAERMIAGKEKQGC